MPTDKEPKESSNPADAMAKAQPYVDAAWQFIGGVLVGALAGWFLDKRLHTTPWLLVTGLMFGFAAGFLSFMRAINRLDARAGKSRPGGTEPKDRS